MGKRWEVVMTNQYRSASADEQKEKVLSLLAAYISAQEAKQP